MSPLRPAGLALALLALLPGRATADGAFPDELQVFAPHQQPQRIVLSTNYGLILSNDDGATWSFVCETAVDTQLVTTYGIGPTVLYAVSGATELVSTDQGCTWGGTDLSSTGALLLTDLFGDPNQDDRSFVITFNQDNSNDLYELLSGSLIEVYPSPSAILEGVEISQSNPAVVYAATSVNSTGDVDVLRSDDGGGGWVTWDHPELSADYPGIAAVDPTDPNTVFLRLSPGLGGGDSLAVTHDSGQTITVLFTAPGPLSAFAVDLDHTWYAGDRTNNLWVGDPDGGITELTGPSLRCLAARSGTLYACGDEQTDGFVLGASTDRGLSFQPLVTPSTYQTASCAPVRAVCPLIDGGPSPAMDAGTPVVDAGPPDHLDAGSPSSDAGHEPVDAGKPVVDAGREEHLDGGARDAGSVPLDGGQESDAGRAEPDAGASLTHGCGCSGGGGSWALGLLSLGALLERRRSLQARGVERAAHSRRVSSKSTNPRDGNGA